MKTITDIATIAEADENLLRAVMETDFTPDTETEKELCDLVSKLFFHIEKTTSQKSYQQIAGDGATDRALGGDTAPASPGHTPEPWKTDKRPDLSMEIQTKAGVPVAVMAWHEHTMNDNAARICATINACAGMIDPAAEIKALRDALENFCRQVEFTKYDFPPEILPEHRGSAINVVWEAARAALKGATK